MYILIFISCLFADVRDTQLHQLSGRWPSRENSAHDRHSKNKAKLSVGEQEGRGHIDEHWALEWNRPPHNSANEYATERASHDQDECLVDVQLRDGVFSAADSSHHRYFLTLLIEITSHRTRQREEANEHRDRNHNIENDLQCWLSLYNSN